MVTLDATLPARVTAQARDIRFTRVLAVLFTGLFYALGWSAAKLLGAAWLCLTWPAAAVRLGWQEARTKPTDRR